MLSSRDLEGMRETLDSSLPDHCTIASGAKTGDGSGGWIPDPDATSTPIDCRVSPLATTGRDFEDVDGSRLVASVPWIATFPDGTVVPSEGRITHVESGHTFEVVGPFDGRTYEIGVRVICRRVT